jgi:hypothetical protein
LLLHLGILYGVCRSFTWLYVMIQFPYLNMHMRCVEIVGKFIAIVAAISESMWVFIWGRVLVSRAWELSLLLLRLFPRACEFEYARALRWDCGKIHR